jgi:Domain of unknown function (DUF4349)
MSEHTWFQENLASYSADGLSVEERERFERHRVACSACAQLLADARAFDESMDKLFSPIRPALGFENRVIDNLRSARSRRKVWSRGMRFVAGIAALILLGILGSIFHGFMIAGQIAFPGNDSSLASRSFFGVLKMEANGTLLPANRKWVYAPTEGVVSSNGSFAFSDAGKGVSGKGQEGEIAYTSMESELVDRLAEIDRLDGEHKNVTTYSVKESGPSPERTESKKELPGAVIIRGTTPLPDKLALWPEQRIHQLDDNTKLGRTGLTPNGTRTLSDQQMLEEAAVKLKTAERMLATKSIAIEDYRSAKMTHDQIYGRLSKQEETAYFTPRLPVTAAAPFAMQLGAQEPKQAKVLAVHPVADLVVPYDTAKSSTSAKNEAQELGKAFSVANQVAEAPPEPSTLKIIRTAEMEFEVDSFDAAVAGITRLIGGIPGGFVLTKKSDKLPNGKVKGVVVVRMPPEKLDKFLLDVRQDLGKIGELKSERVASQDVTKHYTDVTSQLRAARAMEERFLQMIKTGKGEIKDLVLAENELGKWRTKIEEMEGEIRYYNNQVGLSTVTITAYEKEIQAPASLLVTEKRHVQLEVDDVEKAQAAALAVVAEVKGRVSKSELKQHPGGQLQAILQFEVAPAVAGKVSDQLKKLGIVTDQTVDRTQQSQGPGSQLLDIKTKQNDVQFDVTLYNSANIAPREVLNIQVASLDVAGGFRKLQDVVGKAKSRIDAANLNEQDKLNISAKFDFDIPISNKNAVDQTIAEIGKIIWRTANRSSAKEATTDRKIGYRLVLNDVAALPSRDNVSVAIEVKDVRQTMADILNIVKTQKGVVIGNQMNDERNGRIAALLKFKVPVAAQEELFRHFKGAGTIKDQSASRNPQVPDNELATAFMVVTLVSPGPIVPEDEGLWPQIRTSLFYSFKVLTWSLMLVIVGLCLVLPWLLVVWVGFKVVRRFRKKPLAS